MSAVAEAIRNLDERGLVKRLKRDQSERIIKYIEDIIGRPAPTSLKAFYRENVESIGGNSAIVPIWNDYLKSWRPSIWGNLSELVGANAIELFDDGFGNLYGLDLEAGLDDPPVYFFNHDVGWDRPEYAAGSSLARFLLLLGDEDRAFDEKWPARWELAIDPDIDKCSRAPAIWNAPSNPWARDDG